MLYIVEALKPWFHPENAGALTVLFFFRPAAYLHLGYAVEVWVPSRDAGALVVLFCFSSCSFFFFVVGAPLRQILQPMESSAPCMRRKLGAPGSISRTSRVQGKVPCWGGVPGEAAQCKNVLFCFSSHY